MSSAHRPTWNPAVAKDVRIDSQQFSSRALASHTKLKFRKPGQNDTGDVQRRDLRKELELAEKEAAAKKRKAAGLAPLEEVEPSSVVGTIEPAPTAEQDSEERVKRRKLVEEALLADQDADDSDDSDADEPNGANGHGAKGKGKARADDEEDEEEEDEDSDESDDDSDEEAELLRELEKVKRERAEEKERQAREQAAAGAMDREAEVALGNPLLNLRAALGQDGGASPSPSLASSASGFAVKRRWDDDVIFKNQARDVDERPKKEFVNDLLRTEFHKRFLKKFVA